MIAGSLCMLCGAETGGPAPLCRGCGADLPRFHRACRVCGVAVASGNLCGACARHHPPFDRLIAAFPYGYPIDMIIQDIKYRGRLYWLRLLAQELAERVRQADQPLPECLLPVPLHWRRRWSRGFNQAFEIARELGRHLDIPADDGFLRRLRPTASQTEMTAPARRRNVRRAFALVGAAPWKRVAVVDDVVTTGATVEELSRLLKRAGVRQVEVWALARALNPGG